MSLELDANKLRPNRRQLLSGFAVGALAGFGGAAVVANQRSLAASNAEDFPEAAQSSSSAPDVVIVGAGAAGIAAAWSLAKRGISFVLVEAKDRIGGRAYTNTSDFGVPFDAGCAWIYQADHNPMTAIAYRHGYDLLPHQDALEHLHASHGHANSADRLAYDTARQEITLNLRSIGRIGRDVAASTAMTGAQTEWTNVVGNWIGPFDIGADLDQFSALDWWNLDLPWPSMLVRQGYGSLVAKIGAGIPVQLGTSVTSINWGGTPGVRAETSRGTINAKACIVTVSMGVLQSESIRFDPPLPNDMLRAIDDLPMGLLAKIALQFDGARFDLPENSWLSYASTSSEMAHFLAWPFGTNLMIGFVGGRLAWKLTNAGEPAAVDFGMSQLRRILGASVDQHLVSGRFTRWGADPNVRGAFAYGKPGSKGARENLSRPLGNHVFFAGEALGGGMAMTCGGAFVSGTQVAATVAKIVADSTVLFGRRLAASEIEFLR